MGFKTLEDLVILGVEKFNIILGMSWLSPYHAIFEYYTKIITIAIPIEKKLEWEVKFKPNTVRVVSVICAQKLVKKGC